MYLSGRDYQNEGCCVQTSGRRRSSWRWGKRWCICIVLIVLCAIYTSAKTIWKILELASKKGNSSTTFSSNTFYTSLHSSFLSTGPKLFERVFLSIRYERDRRSGWKRFQEGVGRFGCLSVQRWVSYSMDSSRFWSQVIIGYSACCNPCCTITLLI